MAKDRWPNLCALYQNDDGLPVRDAGPWTETKLFFWNRYIDITTRAMVGHPKWPAGLVYVDLFAGPGVCKITDTGRRFPGSTLIAANAPKPFRRILSVELEPALASALSERLSKSAAASIAKVFTGNCDQCIDQIVGEIPERALTLAFVDPENLNINFETIRKLCECGQVDLLILFADRMDLVRNIGNYEKQRFSVLDRMMGPQSQWRQKWKDLSVRPAEAICRLFADEYRLQLGQQLGYRVFGEKIMTSEKGPLYRLIFASKNEKGFEFWDKVTKKDRSGQTEMF